MTMMDDILDELYKAEKSGSTPKRIKVRRTTSEDTAPVTPPTTQRKPRARRSEPEELEDV